MVDSEPPPPQPTPNEQAFRNQIAQEIVQVKTGPNAAERLKQKINEVWSKANMAMQQVKKKVKDKWDKGKSEIDGTFDGAIDDPNKPKHNIEVTHIYAKEAVKAYKENPALIPVAPGTTGHQVIRKLVDKIDNPEEITNIVAPYVDHVIRRAINGMIANPLRVLTEEEFRQLKDVGGPVGQKVIDSLAEVAIDQGQDTAEVAQWKSRVEAPPPSPTQTTTPQEGKQPDNRRLSLDESGEHTVRFLRVSKEYELPDEKEIHNSYQLRDFISIGTRLREPDDHELLAALLSPRNLDVYIGKMIKHEFEKYKNKPQGAGVTAENFDGLKESQKDHIAKEISDEFGKQIKLLIGKLFREVDETAPEEFWEEAARAGSPFENTDTQSQAFMKQLSNLRFENYKSLPNIDKIKFYSRIGFEEDVRVPIKTLYPNEKGVKEEGSEVRRVVGPFYNSQEVSLREFFLTLVNGAKDEIGVRKFLHNATALRYQPPPEKGYYRQLANYAENFLPASAIDILSQLPDSDAFYSASQLEDKLLETDYAMHNWVHKPTLSNLDLETKRSERSDRAIEYLGGMYEDLLEGDKTDPYESWRIRRALSMGIGDNNSISLKAIEHGARADAPKSVEGGYGGDIASYDIKDHLPFMAFNPFNHYNLRYSMDRTTFGDLIFLPVEGDIKRSKFDWWDHRDMIKQMEKMKNSFVTGRDTDRQTMLVDYTNIGRTGSIYTRTASIEGHSSWRKVHSYEGYVDGFGDSHNVKNTWKNLENIGIEVMIDYIDRIGSKGYKANFYDADSTPARKELFDHVYRRYFHERGVKPEDVPAAEVEVEFKKLEGSDKIKSAYKEFYYKTMVRAMRQRIPTKFVRFERNREVVGRKRAWEEVRIAAGNMADVPYRQAVRDLAACEVYERKEATKQIRDGIEKMKDDKGDLTADAPQKLHLHDVDYELTEDKVRRYLADVLKVQKISDQQKQERIDNAVKVLNKIYDFTDDPNTDKKSGKSYLDNFAKKYEHHVFPFAMAVEELERSLLAQRASGERTPTRAIADIAAIEEKVCNVFADYFLKLKDVATNGKKDPSELVHMLETAKDQLEVDIGPDYAAKFSHHMAAVTISYFKKDTAGRFLATRILDLGRDKKYSIAAEFAGTNRGVWEWNVNDINNFINTLEAKSIIPKDAYEVMGSTERRNIQIVNPFTKKVIATLPFKANFRHKEIEWNGSKLRKDFGGTGAHIFFEYANKAVPIVLLLALFHYIKSSIEEATGGK